jgi:hypothetical protein
MLASTPDLDAAILDLRLGNDTSEALAEALHKRGVPFAFASGHGADGVPGAFKAHPVLRKPFLMEELERCLSSLLG